MTRDEANFIKAYKEICKCNVEIVRAVSRGEYRYEVRFFHYRFLKWFKKDYTENIGVLSMNARDVGGTPHSAETITKLRYKFNSEEDATKVVNVAMKQLHSLAAPYIGDKNGATVNSRSVKEVIFLESL